MSHAGFERGLVVAVGAAGAVLAFLVAAIQIPKLDSDGLHTFLLVRDLIERRGDVIWQCTTNFYFFPALFFVALGEALFDDPGLVHLTSFAAQALAIAGAGVVYARVAAPLARPRQWVLAALSLSCLYLVALIACPIFGFTAVIPTSHGMHVPVALLVYALFLAQVTRPSRAGAAGFVVLGTLLLLSDVIFMVWQFAALALASFAAFAIVRTDLRGLARATLLIAAPVLLSTGAKFAIETTGRFNRKTRGGKRSLAEILASLEEFLHDAPRIEGAATAAGLAALALLVAAALLLAARRPRFRAGLALRLGSLGASRLLWMGAIAGAGVLASLSLPLLTGAWESRGSARYFANLAFLPLLWVTHVALAAAAWRPAALAGLALASLALAVASAASRSEAFDPRRVLAPYPERVAALDALAQVHGLRFGFGDYSLANQVRALSRRGLVVVAVQSDLDPYVWSTSADVYFETSRYDFVILARLDREAVRRRLGAPHRVEQAGPLEVWLYDRVADAPRFGFFRAEALAKVQDRGLMLREAWLEEPRHGP